METLRWLLGEPPSREGWLALDQALHACWLEAPQRFSEVALPYVRAHVSAWPRSIRTLTPRVYLEAVEGRLDPCMELMWGWKIPIISARRLSEEDHLRAMGVVPAPGPAALSVRHVGGERMQRALDAWRHPQELRSLHLHACTGRYAVPLQLPERLTALALETIALTSFSELPELRVLWMRDMRNPRQFQLELLNELPWSEQIERLELEEWDGAALLRFLGQLSWSRLRSLSIWGEIYTQEIGAALAALISTRFPLLRELSLISGYNSYGLRTLPRHLSAILRAQPLERLIVRWDELALNDAELGELLDALELPIQGGLVDLELSGGFSVLHAPRALAWAAQHPSLQRMRLNARGGGTSRVVGWSRSGEVLEAPLSRWTCEEEAALWAIAC